MTEAGLAFSNCRWSRGHGSVLELGKTVTKREEQPPHIESWEPWPEPCNRKERRAFQAFVARTLQVKVTPQTGRRQPLPSRPIGNKPKPIVGGQPVRGSKPKARDIADSALESRMPLLIAIWIRQGRLQSMWSHHFGGVLLQKTRCVLFVLSEADVQRCSASRGSGAPQRARSSMGIIGLLRGCLRCRDQPVYQRGISLATRASA